MQRPIDVPQGRIITVFGAFHRVFHALFFQRHRLEHNLKNQFGTEEVAEYKPPGVPMLNALARAQRNRVEKPPEERYALANQVLSEEVLRRRREAIGGRR